MRAVAVSSFPYAVEAAPAGLGFIKTCFPELCGVRQTHKRHSALSTPDSCAGGAPDFQLSTYALQSSNATKIGFGDPVVLGAATSSGTPYIVQGTGALATTQPVVGIFQGCGTAPREAVQLSLGRRSGLGVRCQRCCRRPPRRAEREVSGSHLVRYRADFGERRTGHQLHHRSLLHNGRRFFDSHGRSVNRDFDRHDDSRSAFQKGVTLARRKKWLQTQPQTTTGSGWIQFPT